MTKMTFVLLDAIRVMLLKHDSYSTFTRKPIADAHRASQVQGAAAFEEA
jgi:predicted lactoylglutathione lyase